MARSATFTRMRGSTSPVRIISDSLVVYPACAGIDLTSFFCFWWCVGLPRMRGDRPSDWGIWVILARFTPHARGSTSLQDGDFSSLDVYPACAGIDLFLENEVNDCLSLPRMRGDRPLGKRPSI